MEISKLVKMTWFLSLGRSVAVIDDTSEMFQINSDVM
jgi:hypothetical protein